MKNLYFMEQFLIFQLNLPPEDSHMESHRDRIKLAATTSSANFEDSALKESCSDKLRHIYCHQKPVLFRSCLKTTTFFH